MGWDSGVNIKNKQHDIMFTNFDKVYMPYRKECLRFYHNQVGCDIFIHTAGMLTLCNTGKNSPIFQPSNVYDVPFGCHLRNHAETIVLRPLVKTSGKFWKILLHSAHLASESWHHGIYWRKAISPSGKPFRCVLGFRDGNMVISLLFVLREIQNQVYPLEWCRLLDAQLGNI